MNLKQLQKKIEQLNAAYDTAALKIQKARDEMFSLSELITELEQSGDASAVVDAKNARDRQKLIIAEAGSFAERTLNELAMADSEYHNDIHRAQSLAGCIRDLQTKLAPGGIHDQTVKKIQQSYKNSLQSAELARERDEYKLADLEQRLETLAGGDDFSEPALPNYRLAGRSQRTKWV